MKKFIHCSCPSGYKHTHTHTWAVSTFFLRNEGARDYTVSTHTRTHTHTHTFSDCCTAYKYLYADYPSTRFPLAKPLLLQKSCNYSSRAGVKPAHKQSSRGCHHTDTRWHSTARTPIACEMRTELQLTPSRVPQKIYRDCSHCEGCLLGVVGFFGGDRPQRMLLPHKRQVTLVNIYDPGVSLHNTETGPRLEVHVAKRITHTTATSKAKKCMNHCQHAQGPSTELA